MQNEEEKENIEQVARPEETSEESDYEGPPDVDKYVITSKLEKVEIPEVEFGWPWYTRTYICPEVSCEYHSEKKTHVRQHFQTHSGEKPYQCKICKKKFAQKGSCVKHIRTHDDKFKFKCNACDAMFTEYCKLKKHSIAEHNIDNMPKTVGEYYYQMNGAPWNFSNEEW